MKNLALLFALLFTAPAFAADRVIINPDSDGDLKLKVNMSVGGVTDVLKATGSTGALTLGSPSGSTQASHKIEGYSNLFTYGNGTLTLNNRNASNAATVVFGSSGTKNGGIYSSPGFPFAVQDGTTNDLAYTDTNGAWVFGLTSGGSSATHTFRSGSGQATININAGGATSDTCIGLNKAGSAKWALCNGHGLSDAYALYAGASTLVGSTSQAGTWVFGPTGAASNTSHLMYGPTRTTTASSNILQIVANTGAGTGYTGMLGLDATDFVMSTNSNARGLRFEVNNQNFFAINTSGVLLANSANWATDATIDVCFTANAGAGSFSRCSSSERYKYDIAPLSFDSAKIYELEAKEFRWKRNGVLDFGFIAEEVEKVMPEAVVYNRKDNGDLVLDDDGDAIPESVKYKQITAAIVEEMKKLRAEVVALRSDYQAYKLAHP